MTIELHKRSEQILLKIDLDNLRISTTTIL